MLKIKKIKENITKLFLCGFSCIKSFVMSNFFKRKKTKKSEKLKEEEAKETIRLFFGAVILAILIRSFWFEPFHIPSESMKPNLLIGDYIVVKKYSYGYSKYSAPFGLFSVEGRAFQNKNKKPKRGDVVVFKFTQDTKINFVKRLIGMPGDKIQVKSETIYINGKPVNRKYKGQSFSDGRTFELYEETLPNGVTYDTWEEYANSPADNTIEFTVPKGHYFFMGDNRDNSQDSRFMSSLGFVPEENLLGKTNRIVLSVKEPIWKVWKAFNNFRKERFWKSI